MFCFFRVRIPPPPPYCLFFSTKNVSLFYKYTYCLGYLKGDVMIINDQELGGFRRDRYFVRALRLTTKEKGWWKTPILLMLACFVPLVGPLGVSGYILEWMRSIAWGNNTGLQGNKVGIAQSIASGWRAFVIDFVYLVAYGLVVFIAFLIPVLNGSLVPLLIVLGFPLVYFVGIAQLRATIYQKIGAGFAIKPIVQMMKHDFLGLGRIFCLSVVINYVVSIISSIFMAGSLFSFMVALMEEGFLPGRTMTVSTALRMLATASSMTVPSFILNTIIAGAVGVALNLIVNAALGLWMRQFNLPAWGQSKDPLPPFIYDPRDEAPSQQGAALPQSVQTETQTEPTESANTVASAEPQPTYGAPTTATESGDNVAAQSDCAVSQPDVVENHSEEAGEKNAGNDPFAPVQ